MPQDALQEQSVSVVSAVSGGVQLASFGCPSEAKVRPKQVLSTKRGSQSRRRECDTTGRHRGSAHSAWQFLSTVFSVHGKKLGSPKSSEPMPLGHFSPRIKVLNARLKKNVCLCFQKMVGLKHPDENTRTYAKLVGKVCSARMLLYEG